MFPYDNCDGALDGNEGGPFRCYQDNAFATYKPHYTKICDYIVGVEENILNTSIQIVPNPAVSQIKIMGNLTPQAKFMIVYASGKNWTVNQNNNMIDISTLPSGIYILSILQNNGVSRHKFIVK